MDGPACAVAVLALGIDHNDREACSIEPFERRSEIADLLVVDHGRRFRRPGPVPVCDRALLVEIDQGDLFARLLGGYDWTKRFPWVVEAALKHRQPRFLIDGEAVILGVDGISDFDALHSGRHNEEVQLCAFDILALDATICASCRCEKPVRLTPTWN